MLMALQGRTNSRRSANAAPPPVYYGPVAYGTAAIDVPGITTTSAGINPQMGYFKRHGRGKLFLPLELIPELCNCKDQRIRPPSQELVRTKSALG